MTLRAYAIVMGVLMAAASVLPQAHAQSVTKDTCTTSDATTVCTPEIAAQAALLYVKHAQPVGNNGCKNVYGTEPLNWYAKRSTATSLGGGAMEGWLSCTGGEMKRYAVHRIDVECPADKPWNEVTKTCGNPCTEKKGQSAGRGVVKGGGSTACKGKCEAKPVGLEVCMGVGSETICGGGEYQFTGNTCATDKEPKPEECMPIDGQTLCMKPDGSKCATASNGKQICFGNGETGTKTEGSTLAKSDAGPNHTPPNTQLISGDTLTKTGGPTTTTTNTTTNNTTGTNVTNITTYRTDNGTNAGSTNQGTNTGGTSSGGGEGEGDGTDASGGANCENPPIVSGDAALNMVANQAWATRCAVEAGNAVSVTGDVGDCKSAFSVQGDPTDANVQKLRAMRKTACPHEGEGNSETDYGDGTLTAGDAFGTGTWDGALSALDTTGFGWGQSCPVWSLRIGPSLTLDSTELCKYMQAFGALIYLAAFAQAAYIIGRN
jgi:hypothetical protein